MSAFNHGYALIIGVNENKLPSYALPDTEKDVVALAKVLLNKNRGGYLQENVKILLGADATKNGIMDGLTWLDSKLEEDDSDNETAIIYFSGHGHVHDEKHYLFPYNLTPAFQKSALPAARFAERIAQIRPARLFVVLDCCHAGAAGIKGGRDERAVDFKPSAVKLEEIETDVLSAGEGRAVLSSSKGVESSFMRKDGKMSIFTYFLIQALYGYAQAPGAGNQVRVSDILGHVSAQVPKMAKKEWKNSQTPNVFFTGENFPVAMLIGGKGVANAANLIDPVEDDLLNYTSVNVTGDGNTVVVQQIGEKGVDVINSLENLIGTLGASQQKPREALKEVLQGLNDLHGRISDLKMFHNELHQALISLQAFISTTALFIGKGFGSEAQSACEILWEAEEAKYTRFEKAAKKTALLQEALQSTGEDDYSAAIWINEVHTGVVGISSFLAQLNGSTAANEGDAFLANIRKFNSQLIKTLGHIDDALKIEIERLSKLSSDAALRIL